MYTNERWPQTRAVTRSDLTHVTIFRHDIYFCRTSGSPYMHPLFSWYVPRTIYRARGYIITRYSVSFVKCIRIYFSRSNTYSEYFFENILNKTRVYYYNMYSVCDRVYRIHILYSKSETESLRERQEVRTYYIL